MEKMKLNIQLFGASVSLTASATSATDETAITTNQNYINLAIRVQTTKPTWNGNKTAYYQVTTTSQNNGTQTGSKYYFSIGSSSGSGDKTFNVTLGPFDHNADGTLNDVSISVYVKITDSTNRTATKSVVMGTIPRASAIQNITSGTTDFAPTLTWTPYSSTFKYIIRYLYGSWTYQTDWITPNSTNPQTYNGYTITSASIGPYIPNSTSATILASLYTYTSDGQLVGYSDANFTITLNSNVKPTINSRTLTENGSTPSNWGVWVKTKSKVRVQTSASGIYGSTISSIVTTLDGYTYNGADITSNFLNTAGSLVCQTIVTDSRGRQASSSTTISVQDYYNPSFSAVQIQRCDANGNIDDNGAYCYFNFGGSVATCSNQNKGTYRIKYKLHSASTYTEIPAIATNVQSLSTSGFITDDGTQQGTKTQFSTSDTYDFVFSIQDQFTTSTNNQTLDTGFDLMNFNASGKAMAIGKYSEANSNQELFEVGIDTIIDGDLSVNKVIYGGATIQAQNPSGETDIICKDTNGNFIYIYAHNSGHGMYDNVHGALFSVYNGGKHLEGDWIVDGSIKSKNACCYWTNQSITWSTNWEWQKMVWGGITYNNTNIFIDGNEFYIPANVSIVKVSLSISFYNIDIQSSDKNFAVYKNGSYYNQLAYVQYNSVNNAYVNVTGFAYVSVAQNDHLSIWVNSGQPGTMRIFEGTKVLIEIVA